MFKFEAQFQTKVIIIKEKNIFIVLVISNEFEIISKVEETFSNYKMPSSLTQKKGLHFVSKYSCIRYCFGQIISITMTEIMFILTNKKLSK